MTEELKRKERIGIFWRNLAMWIAVCLMAWTLYSLIVMVAFSGPAEPVQATTPLVSTPLPAPKDPNLYQDKSDATK